MAAASRQREAGNVYSEIRASRREGLAGGASNLAFGFPQIAGQNIIGGGGLQQQAKGQQLGMLQGLFQSAATVGAGALACWVADALWGEGQELTLSARRWVLEHDNVFTRAYIRHGRTWAAWVRTHKAARYMAWPIWRTLAWLGAR